MQKNIEESPNVTITNQNISRNSSTITFYNAEFTMKNTINFHFILHNTKIIQ